MYVYTYICIYIYAYMSPLNSILGCCQLSRHIWHRCMDVHKYIYRPSVTQLSDAAESIEAAHHVNSMHVYIYISICALPWLNYQMLLNLSRLPTTWILCMYIYIYPYMPSRDSIMGCCWIYRGYPPREFYARIYIYIHMCPPVTQLWDAAEAIEATHPVNSSLIWGG